MTNEKSSDSPTADTHDQSPPQPPVTPPAPLQGALPDDGKERTDEYKNKTNELVREFRIAEKWVIGTNIILAIIGIFALCIYQGQLNVMRGQLGEIIKQYPELQKSANAATSGSNTANGAFEESKKEFRIQQRPYITLSELRPNGQLMAGNNKLVLSIINSGRTPALKIHILLNAYINQRVIMNTNPAERSESVLASDKQISNTYTITLSGSDFAETSSREFTVRGTIRYTDIFREWHITSFCGRYSIKEQTQFKYCPDGNEVD
jgi:hypothetical protein